METSRQKAFQELRPICIDLSSEALKYRAQQSSLRNVLQALEALHAVLIKFRSRGGLDERLAQYAFFPLSHVFNESQRLSSRCLEVAVHCLQILVTQGWRQNLQPDMGKQLLILLGLLAGASPTRSEGQDPSEELVSACYDCMSMLFDALSRGTKHTLFDETAPKTIVDQSVYLLLEGLGESPSETVQLAAAHALRGLLSHISNRVLLASLMPRTVSALTRVLRPTTKIRRSFHVIVTSIDLLRDTLSAVLADKVALNIVLSQKRDFQRPGQASGNAVEASILDEKWLTATASQVKLALANVVRLRTHQRSEVQAALLDLCLMVCEECPQSLSESLPLVLDTTVALLDPGDNLRPGSRGYALQHIMRSNPGVADMMRNSLNQWLNTMPRLMQNNDGKPKQQVLRQISSSFQLLYQSDQTLHLTDDFLATSLVGSVSAVVDLEQSKPRTTISEPLPSLHMSHLREESKIVSFEPVIYTHKSESESLAELQSLVGHIARSSACEKLAQSTIAWVGQSSGSEQLAALWLSLNLIQQNRNAGSVLSEFVEVAFEASAATTHLIADLYSVSLPLLLHDSTASASHDWRLSALALESIVLQADQLGASYRPELIDTLYPVISFLGSPETQLQSHAMNALKLLAEACAYPDTGAMLVENVDYLVNSIALKLNSFDVSPQGPQVLLIMLRLCGARLIPYLDDMIASIFAALNNFHGYPRLVELLFKVLGVLVDAAAKNPTTVVTEMEAKEHAKTRLKPSTTEDILEDVQAYRKRWERREAEAVADRSIHDTSLTAPSRPWTSEFDGPQSLQESDGEEELDKNDAQGSPLQAEDENEKPLPKSYSLLLSVAYSTIPHLSSPSAHVRLTLLQLLVRIAPVLARHENSFLPLVNDLWPAILPRLFSTESRIQPHPDQEDRKDPIYVNVAAAGAIAALCEGAGDFMSGRIEDLFPHLERIYRHVWSETKANRQRTAQHRAALVASKPSAALDGNGSTTGSMVDIRGTVDLRIVQPPPPPPTGPVLPSTSTNPSPSTHLNTRILNPAHQTLSHPKPPPPNTTTATTLTSNMRTTTTTKTTDLHTSLTHLLNTLLTHVRMHDSTCDAISLLLGPIIAAGQDDPLHAATLKALQTWNADAVWVMLEEVRRGKRVGGVVVGRDDDQEEMKKPDPVTWWDGTVLQFGDGFLT